jgi:hypothetical protein
MRIWKGESIVLLNAKHKVNINEIKYYFFYTHAYIKKNNMVLQNKASIISKWEKINKIK